MTLANPLALLWGLLAVPIVILYWRRIRLRRETVSTDMIWERVFAEQRARSFCQRWRHPVSLAVQLVALVLIVVALAEPLIPAPRRIVLVIDNSNSMNATDVAPTRLARARQFGEWLIGGLRPCDRMALITAGSPVAVRCTLTSDPHGLRDVLRSVPAGRATTRVDKAVALARRLLADKAGEGIDGGEIVILTDARFPGAAELAAAEDVQVQVVLLGKRSGNVAINRLNLRRSIVDPRTCQVLIEATNFSDKPLRCPLVVELDDKPIDVEQIKEQIKLAANGRWQHVLEFTAPDSGQLTARLEHQDAFADDNKASCRVPSAGDDAQAGVVACGESLLAEQPGLSESDLRVPEESGFLTTLPAGPPDLPVWIILVGAAALLLVVEWRLYQRRWIS